MVLATETTGAAAFEGRVSRVAVTPLGRGEVAAPSRPVTIRTGVGAVRIAFRQFGSGPNLVLVMGEHGTMSWWDPLWLNALAQHFRVTIFDEPEVGYSATTVRPPSVETDGDLLAGLIVALGLTQVTVCGWGMGGQVALSLAERHAPLVAGLVLVDTSAGGSSATPMSPTAVAAFGDPMATVQELASLMFPGNSLGATARAAWLADTALVTPDDVIASAITHQAGAERAAFANGHIARFAPLIHLPTLIFTGGKDLVVPPANSQWLHHVIAGSTLLIDPAGGYGALFSDQGVLTNAIVSLGERALAVSTTTTTLPK